MDQSNFYAVVAQINFVLLGLWWLAVKEGVGLLGDTAASRRTAYLVSLQFVIPGTVCLLAQVAPDITMIWRGSFGVAGAIGVVGILLLASEIRRTSDAKVAPALFRLLGVPLYLLVLIVAAFPHAFVGEHFKPIQAEAALISVLIFLGAQEAWVVAMTPPKATAPSAPIADSSR